MRLKLKKILVPTDFSELSLAAMHYAASLARYTEAEIVLFHVMESYEQHTTLKHVINLNEVVQKAVDEKMSKLQQDNVDLWNIKISTKVATGKIHNEIEKFVNKEKIDLIVMGTHGVSGITDVTRYVLGSNAYRIVHVSKCPVITVHEKQKKKPQFKTIVLPLDTTKETTQKVEFAIALARLFDSTIHVLSVSTFFEEFRYNLYELTSQLNKVAEKITKEGIEVKTKIIRHEDVADSVMEYAEAVKADLIMIMVRAERINETILGSRARKIITQAKTPVLSIRPK